MMQNCWTLLKWKFVNLLSFYNFAGDNMSSYSEVLLLVALNGEAKVG